MGNTKSTTRDLTHAPALVRVLIGAAVGGCAAVGDLLLGPPRAAPLVGWDGLVLTYVVLTWWLIWPLNAGQTAHRATRYDPTRAVSYVLLMSAALASLVAVGAVLFEAGRSHGRGEAERVGFGIASVVLSWAIVHTVYSLRYATSHYSNPSGGVDFNQRAMPTYRDFAYLAFTVGMTFQVSDTALTNSHIRRTVLLHALSAYALDTVIVASTVNLVAGLSH